MAWAEAETQKLFYTKSDSGCAQPALLLLHGAGGSRLDWPDEVQHLPDRAVYNLDLPGHGRSPQPGRESVAAYAADVSAFVRALGLDQVVLAGHSMGGAIALTLALDPPNWLRGMILLGASARLRVAPPILDGLVNDPAAALDLIARLSYGEDRSKSLFQLTAFDAALGDFRACDCFDVRDRLGEIDLPCLVIAGELDQMTPLKYGRALAEALPTANLAVIPAAGHYVMLEAPHSVAALMDAFLKELEVT